MKKIIYILVIFITTSVFSQAFEDGEKLKFRLSYSSFLTAGYATMDVKKTVKNGKKAYHVVGKGKTTGMISWFFKVKDRYETYFYKNNSLPYHFKRKIDEGGYTKDKEILFDQENNNALVINNEKNTKKNYTISGNVQDLLSALYYMRNQDISNFTVGREIVLKLFMDEESLNMKLRFLGRETIKTKFGQIKAAKFRPIVQAGRVFKEKESVTVWVSDDENKIPLRIKASLSVGSLRADLYTYKGLAHDLKIE
ncbi:MAG: DUF3108 domain-containing protein [Flavobacteriaceae bacterium]|nr:DUF3108 domain-containing protein [Flavobacteriaceae bacterium]